MITLGSTPTPTTPRLTMRAPQAADWAVFRGFMQGGRSSFLRDGAAMGVARICRVFCHVLGTWVARGYGAFVLCAKSKNDALGLVGRWHPIESPEREIAWSIWVDAAEGRGYACEAAFSARDHAVGDLGWATAVCYSDHGNTRSVALAERLGAVRDDAAPRPPGDDCLVYRHANGGGA